MHFSTNSATISVPTLINVLEVVFDVTEPPHSRSIQYFSASQSQKYATNCAVPHYGNNGELNGELSDE